MSTVAGDDVDAMADGILCTDKKERRKNCLTIELLRPLALRVEPGEGGSLIAIQPFFPYHLIHDDDDDHCFNAMLTDT